MIDERVRLLRRACTGFGRRGSSQFPWRRRPTPYRVLLAEVLLQHTPSARVVPVFEEVVQRWPTLPKLTRARPRAVEAVLRPLGLQRRRARALVQMASSVARRWRGRLPLRLEDLLEIPGVGRYTAGVTLAVASGQPVPFVDGGISRLLRRYFGLPPGGAQDVSVWELATTVVGVRNPRLLAWGLLDLSRTICRRRPLCNACPLRAGCEFAGKGTVRDPVGADGAMVSARRS